MNMVYDDNTEMLRFLSKRTPLSEEINKLKEYYGDRKDWNGA